MSELVFDRSSIAPSLRQQRLQIRNDRPNIRLVIPPSWFVRPHDRAQTLIVRWQGLTLREPKVCNQIKQHTAAGAWQRDRARMI